MRLFFVSLHPTMGASNSFQRIWSKYQPLITLKLKLAISKNEPQELLIDKFDFDKVSTNKNASPGFTLDYKDGATSNSMKMSTIAREFAAALNENTAVKDLIRTGHFTFKMGSKYTLSIQKH
jgi:hypothetical protein